MVSTQAWYTSMECMCVQLRTVVSYWHLTNRSVICRVTRFLTPVSEDDFRSSDSQNDFSQVTLTITSAQGIQHDFTWQPLDSEDGFCSGWWNVSRKQQSFSGLQSRRWSFSFTSPSISVEQSSTLYHGQSTEPTLMKDAQWDWVSKQISKDLRMRCQLLLTKLIMMLKDNQCGDKQLTPFGTTDIFHL